MNVLVQPPPQTGDNTGLDAQGILWKLYALRKMGKELGRLGKLLDSDANLTPGEKKESFGRKNLSLRYGSKIFSQVDGEASSPNFPPEGSQISQG